MPKAGNGKFCLKLQIFFMLDVKCKIVTTLFYKFIIQLPLASTSWRSASLKSGIICSRISLIRPSARLSGDSDWGRTCVHWIEQGLTSPRRPRTQYRLSGRQFYRSKDPTNSIKVLKEKLASHSTEEAQDPPGTFHRVPNEPLKKKNPITVGRAQRDKTPHSRVACTSPV